MVHLSSCAGGLCQAVFKRSCTIHILAFPWFCRVLYSRTTNNIATSLYRKLYGLGSHMAVECMVNV